MLKITTFRFILMACCYDIAISQTSNYDDPCARCLEAAPCFADGCMFRGAVAPFEWSDPFGACNAGAADCAACYPESQCSSIAPSTDVGDACAQCAEAAPCFADGCMFRDAVAPFEWSDPFGACNAGAADCAACYPESQCSSIAPSTDVGDACAQCAEAAPCFADGCMFRDAVAPFEWSDPFGACNAGAADCAACYPESQCSSIAPSTDVGDACAQCAEAAPCFADGCMFRDAVAPFEWSDPFGACNAGAADCAACYPESQCSSTAPSTDVGEACAQCAEAAPCFTDGCMFRDAIAPFAWSDPFGACNAGAADCAACYPESQCSSTAPSTDVGEACAQCAEAAPCFTDGCMFRDAVAPFAWSDPYGACNAGAADCAACYPESQCSSTAPSTDVGEACAQCAEAAPCFTDGCMFRDAIAPFAWSDPYGACNAGAADCAACYPESSCRNDSNMRTPRDSAIIQLYLVQTDTKEEVGRIGEDAIINVGPMEENSLSILALVKNTTESVLFSLTASSSTVKFLRSVSYTGVPEGGDISLVASIPFLLVSDSYELVVTPEADGGARGLPQTVSFQIVVAEEGVSSSREGTFCLSSLFWIFMLSIF